MEIIISIVSIAILITVVSFSYAFIKKDEKEAGYNEIGTNCIKIKLEDYSSEIKLQNAYPVPDSIGKNTKPYQFTITNECDVPVTYQVNLEVYNDSTMNAKNNIAVLFDENEKKHVLGTNNDSATPIEAEDRNQIKESYKIGESSVRGHETNYHKIVLWLDESAGNETQEKTFKCRVAIEAKQDELAKYTEELLHGADPVITGELIPVEINEEGKAIKADPKEKWYSYGEKKWANAVILNDSEKEKVYGYGEEIPEDVIESYFVWIPKYSYRLFNMGNYETATQVEEKGPTTAIEIHFGLDNTINSAEECATPMNEDRTQGLSGESGTCQVGKLMTHPAFISFDVNGLWVGKFEASNSSSQIEIKPNKVAWRSTTIGNSFNKSRDYKKELDSHMMKNTEWGAVAYLTQSIYGRCKTENDVTTCMEVAQNKNTSYTTGMKDASTAYPKSQEASTTGNNSGIFDMNGGALDQMASVMANNTSSLTPLWSSSELSSINDKRYYDIYNYGMDYNHWNRRILGDATGELGPFQVSENNIISSYFRDYAYFVHPTYPWFYRGGYYALGTAAGIFAFDRGNGAALEYRGFRVVLAPR